MARRASKPKITKKARESLTPMLDPEDGRWPNLRISEGSEWSGRILICDHCGTVRGSLLKSVTPIEELLTCKCACHDAFKRGYQDAAKDRELKGLPETIEMNELWSDDDVE